MGGLATTKAYIYLEIYVLKQLMKNELNKFTHNNCQKHEAQNSKSPHFQLIKLFDIVTQFI